MKTIAYPLLLACLIALGAAGEDTREQSYLGLLQRQIKSVEELAEHARTGSVDAEDARYRFDYARFAADLERVHEGIHNYLSPSRAQPADLVELAGEYRAEAPQSSSPDEHD